MNVMPGVVDHQQLLANLLRFPVQRNGEQVQRNGMIPPNQQEIAALQQLYAHIAPINNVPAPVVLNHVGGNPQLPLQAQNVMGNVAQPLIRLFNQLGTLERQFNQFNQELRQKDQNILMLQQQIQLLRRQSNEDIARTKNNLNALYVTSLVKFAADVCGDNHQKIEQAKTQLTAEHNQELTNQANNFKRKIKSLQTLLTLERKRSKEESMAERRVHSEILKILNKMPLHNGDTVELVDKEPELPIDNNGDVSEMTYWRLKVAEKDQEVNRINDSLLYVYKMSFEEYLKKAVELDKKHQKEIAKKLEEFNATLANYDDDLSIEKNEWALEKQKLEDALNDSSEETREINKLRQKLMEGKLKWLESKISSTVQINEGAGEEEPGENLPQHLQVIKKLEEQITELKKDCMSTRNSMLEEQIEYERWKRSSVSIRNDMKDEFTEKLKKKDEENDRLKEQLVAANKKYEMGKKVDRKRWVFEKHAFFGNKVTTLYTEALNVLVSADLLKSIPVIQKKGEEPIMVKIIIGKRKLPGADSPNNDKRQRVDE